MEIKSKVLVFSKTTEFRHASIPAGISAIQTLGVQNNFDVDTTTNAQMFTASNLKNYAAVIFLSTTGNVLNNDQQGAFESYIKAGGGFVGIHSATDTEYDWPWYGKLVGAYFKNHPELQDATLEVKDGDHISTRHLPERWERFDEWHNFTWNATDLNVLLTIDESTYTGGDHGADHPMAWYHSYDGGRAIYTSLGHTNESFQEPLFQQHLLGAIKYAMGE
ncbi:ThuA domain-containing protein [Mucilaginibacter sp. JRF]|uniref:ThuA domain-containing protein n=1 Tax=Mucilaginibacter sp. JRF TaxID=2780088 RepID=UPI0032217595